MIAALHAQQRRAFALLPPAPAAQNQSVTGRLLPPDEPAGAADGDRPAAAAKAAPMLTMAPHPDNSRYWISGQANIIFQGRLPFHSLYEGPNSFRNSAEYRTSLVGTLYTAVRPTHSTRYATDLILDVESAAGRGLSEALGLAGFTNVDVVRNPNLGSTPYLARGEIHQVIGLTDEMTAQESSPFALAGNVPVRRIEARVGKMTLPDAFDINSVGSDSHLQFMNWTVVNNGAWDYAADTRGYTVGGLVEYDDRTWSLRYGLFAMPTVANGIDLDWAFSRAHAQNAEFEYRHTLVAKHKSVERLLFYANRAHMGVYREAVQAFLAGTDPTPSITQHAHFGDLKYGFGINTEQEITDNLRLFGRFGWNEGQHESFAYTEDDQTVTAGGRLHRKALASSRRQDRPGACLERDQARPPELPSLRGAGLSAGRRQLELRAREHRGELLQRALLARPFLCRRHPAHR